MGNESVQAGADVQAEGVDVVRQEAPEGNRPLAAVPHDLVTAARELCSVLSSRWSLPLMDTLNRHGTQRSRELWRRHHSVGMSARMQAVTLRALAAWGLVERTELPNSRPLAVAYSLTPRGKQVFAWALVARATLVL